MMIPDIKCTVNIYVSDMTDHEAHIIVKQAMDEWFAENPDKEISKIDIHESEDKQEVKVHIYEKSPVTRTRRITGYLSNIDNFNEAKKAECLNRFTHF